MFPIQCLAEFNTPDDACQSISSPTFKIPAADLQTALQKIDYELKARHIVLIMAGVDKHWGTEHYMSKGCGMGRDATLWILEHGIRVVGTDAWDWDRQFSMIEEEFQKTGNASIIWEGHFAGIEKAFLILSEWFRRRQE